MKTINLTDRSESEICAELKKVVDLHDFKIKEETLNKNSILCRFYYNNFIEISINTIVWKNSNSRNFKRYKAQIKLKNTEITNYTRKQLKTILLTDIYKQIIKNNIMMI